MAPVFYDVNDVQDVLRCKESKAYRVIRECNKELKALGFIIHPGKVSAEYFLGATRRYLFHHKQSLRNSRRAQD